MAAISKVKVFRGLFTVAFILLLLVMSLYFLNRSTRNLAKFDPGAGAGDEYYLWIVLLVLLGVIVLVVLISANLYRLIVQYRKGESGSRLIVRMVFLFVVLSVIPGILIFFFSLQLINKAIDKRSDQFLKNAAIKAIELSQTSLDLRKREYLRRTREMSKSFGELKPLEASLKLSELREDNEANELLIMTETNIVAYSGQDPSEKPKIPSDVVQRELLKNGTYVGFESTADAGLLMRVAVRIPARSSEPALPGQAKDQYLHALFPANKRIEQLSKRVETSLRVYKKREFLMPKLKDSFVLTLSLVLLVSLFSAVWAAFFSSRRLVAPIRDLAEATKAVASGDYNKQISSSSRDELGFLVTSFNDMTQQIAQAQSTAQRSKQLVEEQRGYLQAVLANLSSGVMTLDRDHVFKISNSQASQILGIDLGHYVNRAIVELQQEHEHLRSMVEVIKPYLDRDANQWQQEVVLFAKGGRKVLLCRGTTLTDENGRVGDHIIVFDDITMLEKAQRDAAWGEVARRLAHEIKNPLTPIQLAADRLRRRYLDQMDEEDAELLDRSTHTIVQQVEAMKEMVNAFSEYARTPKLTLEPLNLNRLIREVTDLYTVSEKNLNLQLQLSDTIPEIDADSGRLRQLLHNLIKNAIEAMEFKKLKKLDIVTRYVEDPTTRAVEMVIRDYGDGFPDEALSKHFEPYFTSKPKGTGLGLAIVKRIVEEHGGIVWAENEIPNGAKIVIRIPVSYADGRMSNEENPKELGQV